MNINLTIKAQMTISNDESGWRHVCLFIRIFINNFFLITFYYTYTPIDL